MEFFVYIHLLKAIEAYLTIATKVSAPQPDPRSAAEGEKSMVTFFYKFRNASLFLSVAQHI